MKFSCTQENLKRGLLITSTVANKNLNLPILNNVLMKIEGTTIRFLSTNLEVAVQCLVRGKVESPGEFTIPSKLFLDFVNLLPDDRVDMELIDDQLKISSKKNQTKIKGIASSEFPLIPSVERNTVFYVSGQEFRKALNQVNFSVSNVESRPELTGVLFNVNPEGAKGKLTLAATDSYRLSEKQLPLLKDKDNSSTDKSVQVIVPGKTLSELSRILALHKDGEDAVDKVEIALGDSQVVFTFGDVELISRVIDGKYPDYRPIIPESFSSEILVSKSELVQAVKGASLFSKIGLQDVHIDIEPESGLKVSSGDGQTGKNESLIEGKVSGGNNKITLNYKYVVDGLGAIDDASVRLKIIDSTNPCVLTPSTEPHDEKFTYIVMPIKQ